MALIYYDISRVNFCSVYLIICQLHFMSDTSCLKLYSAGEVGAVSRPRLCRCADATEILTNC